MDPPSPTLPGIVSVQVPGFTAAMPAAQQEGHGDTHGPCSVPPIHTTDLSRLPKNSRATQLPLRAAGMATGSLHTLKGPRHPEGPHRAAHGVTVPCPAQGLCHSLSCQLLGKGEEGKIHSRLVLNSASALQQPVVRTCLSPLKCTQALCRGGPPLHPRWLLGTLLGWGRTCWSWGKLWRYQTRHQE